MKIIYKNAELDISSWYNEYVAKDPNTPQEILTKILRIGNDDWVSRYAALHPNCPAEILVEVLKRKKDNDVSCDAVLNPNFPSQILAKIIRDNTNHDIIRLCAVENPNCPIDVLEEILARKKYDLLAQYASKNKNCPLKAKIEWMIAVGKITKEDPQKHKIEYDEKLVDDTDFNKFKDLVSESKDNIKISQTKKDFIDIGYEQRAEPEHCMLEAQKAIGGGVLSLALEHGGDLIHRMNDPNTFEYGGYGYVKEKVDRLIYYLSNSYGFIKEHNENMEQNKKYRKIDDYTYNVNIETALFNYIQAHKKLKKYNRAHILANQVAISIAELDVNEALRCLYELKSHMSSEDEWVDFCRVNLVTKIDQNID